MSNLINKSFFQDIREILNKARQKTYAAINFAMVEAYWQIGKRIVDEEQAGKERADYGSYLIKRLSKELSMEFGKGFSVANLWNFRQFYLTFPSEEKLYTLRRELSWSHLRLIMRVDNPKAREYYLKEAADQTWSTRQLDRNISTLYYERILSSSDKKKLLKNEKTFSQYTPMAFIKDPYVLEFLNLPEDYTIPEKEIETAIISNLQKFIYPLYQQR